MTDYEKTEMATGNSNGHFGFSRFFSVFLGFPGKGPLGWGGRGKLIGDWLK